MNRLCVMTLRCWGFPGCSLTLKQASKSVCEQERQVSLAFTLLPQWFCVSTIRFIHLISNAAERVKQVFSQKVIFWVIKEFKHDLFSLLLIKAFLEWVNSSLELGCFLALRLAATSLHCGVEVCYRSPRSSWASLVALWGFGLAIAYQNI